MLKSTSRTIKIQENRESTLIPFHYLRYPKKSNSVIMELSGKVIQKLNEINGQSKAGNAWRKQEYIIETPGQYPKKVCVAIWGDKIDQFPMTVGDQVNLGVDVESREYNGRWYTEVKAYKVDKPQGASSPSANEMPDVSTFHDDSEENNLPF